MLVPIMWRMRINESTMCQEDKRKLESKALMPYVSIYIAAQLMLSRWLNQREHIQREPMNMDTWIPSTY